MSEKTPKPEELASVKLTKSAKGWMDPKVNFRTGTWCYSAVPESLEQLGLANPRKWQPTDEDWQLPTMGNPQLAVGLWCRELRVLLLTF